MRYQLTDDSVHSVNHQSQPTSFITKTPRHCHPSCHLTPPSFMQSYSLAGYKSRSIPHHHQAKANDRSLKDSCGLTLFVFLSVSLLLVQAIKLTVQIPAHVASFVGGRGILLTHRGARNAYAPQLMPANHLFAPCTNHSRNSARRCCRAICQPRPAASSYLENTRRTVRDKHQYISGQHIHRDILLR
jgi:hypothetical protein